MPFWGIFATFPPLRADVVTHKYKTRVSEPFKDNPAQEWQPVPACPTAQSRNLVLIWLKIPVLINISWLRLPEVAVPGGALGERVVVVGGELGAAPQPLRGDDGGDGAEAGVVEGAEVAVGREGVVHLVAKGGWKTETA